MIAKPKKTRIVTPNLQAVGWREWVHLPELHDIAIKAKVDTGAKTSSLHAFYIEPFTKQGQSFIRFLIHPLQKNTDYEVECEAPVLDRREVTDSGGHSELRYVIQTRIIIGNQSSLEELTLTARDNMMFRMLLGRSALKGKYSVDSNSSFLMGGRSRRPPVLPAAKAR